MPPAKKRTAAATHPPDEATAPAPSGGSAGKPSAEVGSGPSAKPPHRPPEPFTLRLPFLSVSVSRPPHESVGGAPSSGAAPSSAAGQGGPVPPRAQRLLFYGGVAALGVAGVVDWPVAAAIAAGTWVATRTRGAGGRTPPAGT